jgi:hypothetical protein
MKFERDEHSPQEILMNALPEIDGAKGIAILIDKGDTFLCRSNMEYKELKWVLDQAQFMMMAYLFGINYSSKEQGESPDEI